MNELQAKRICRKRLTTAVKVASMIGFCCSFSSFRGGGVVAARSSTNAIYKVRGGVGRSPYEFNPNYIAPGNNNNNNNKTPPPPPPPTLGDLERTQVFSSRMHVETQRYDESYGEKERPSTLGRVKAYAQRIHQMSPSLSIVTAVCMFVFVLWQVPSFQGTLSRNFVCNRTNLQQGRWLSLLFAAVSHASPMHLLVNLFAYLNFGPKVLGTLQTTNWPLFPLVMGSALAGSVLYLVRNIRGGCMGLSGVTLSFLAFLARAYPNHEMAFVLLVFPIRLKAEILLRCLLVWSLIGSLSNQGSVAHITHLGGLLFGMGYYEMWRERHRLRGMLSRVRSLIPTIQRDK
uniref:Peptidase S54 rhomboid domain-containing protein n=1 Tax=Cyclophora tenuis TaxID=216820 RepID=A0A7S1DD09_CYCTE|mmetsp:Transcript_7247/g.12614  ORF Transcript_7247/g.12614 Transcript_7247/m.12614 type:complete len:344 (+) Transcript_7247:22-1053(+)